MRHLLLPLVLATAVQIFAAAPPASARTVLEIPNFPLQALRSGVGKKLYSSLAISPVSAWVMARAAVVNGHTMGAQIVHSEGNGVYDKALVAMANDYTVTGGNTTETRLQKDTLNVHLLIYDLKDGKMAICFSNRSCSRLDGATGSPRTRPRVVARLAPANRRMPWCTRRRASSVAPS